MERRRPPTWAIILFVISYSVFFAIGFAIAQATSG